MAKYVAYSDSPIHVASKPDWEWPGLPGGPDIGLPGEPDPGPGKPKPPWAEWRPPEGWREWVEEIAGALPPREEWPPLPPDWRELLGDRIGHPVQPLPPETGEPPMPPGVTWPPTLPDMPDFSGKTLVLVRVYVSRRVNFLRWIVLDHDAIKAALKDALERLKDRVPPGFTPPAGGIGGRPPDRPGPGIPPQPKHG